jgi:phosphatidylglycerol---prolipoprotein diacylglyceryl transferase
MIPVLFQLGPLRLYSFGAMLALAFLAAGAVVEDGLERRGLDRGHVTPIVLWAAVGGVLGSRVLALANEWQAFLAAPIERLVTGAGFVWYGGLLGGFIAVSAYIAIRRLPWLVVVDALAPGLALGQAIGRVGCQLAGDGDWGTVSTLPWAMAYPRAIFGWDLPAGVLVHPAPVYESLLYSAIFLVLLRASRQEDRLAPGSVLFGYLILSGVARFLVEFVRIEPRLWLGLTEAQWFGIATVGAGGLGLLWASRHQRRLSAALGLLLAIVVGTAGCTNATQAPDFVAQDLQGQAVRLSAQRGKVVFLNLWTTWCPPCRLEMPAMQDLANKLVGDDFVMLAVSEDDGVAPVEKFIEEMKISFPVLVDPTGEVGRRFGITGYPETFIIDREGRQVARFIGPKNWKDPAIERDLRTLIDTGQWVRAPDGDTR